jgi:hypothetical protein
MTREQHSEILAAIDALNDGRTYLHLAMMAATSLGDEDGNALLRINDLATDQLMLVREILYRVNGTELPSTRRGE